MRNLISVNTRVQTGNNGDYENAEEEEEEEEEVEVEGGVGGVTAEVTVMRAHSMGCTAEEAWKRYVLHPTPYCSSI